MRGDSQENQSATSPAAILHAEGSRGTRPWHVAFGPAEFCAPPAAGTAELLDSAREVLRTEAGAVAALAERLNDGFAACCRMLAGYAGLALLLAALLLVARPRRTLGRGAGALLLACYLGWMGGTAAAPG